MTIDKLSIEISQTEEKNRTFSHSLEEVDPRRRGHPDFLIHLEGGAIIGKEIKIFQVGQDGENGRLWIKFFINVQLVRRWVA